jgi:hypothetical protein
MVKKERNGDGKWRKRRQKPIKSAAPSHGKEVNFIIMRNEDTCTSKTITNVHCHAQN